jgi:hypothetical protein
MDFDFDSRTVSVSHAQRRFGLPADAMVEWEKAGLVTTTPGTGRASRRLDAATFLRLCDAKNALAVAVAAIGDETDDAPIPSWDSIPLAIEHEGGRLVQIVCVAPSFVFVAVHHQGSRKHSVDVLGADSLAELDAAVTDLAERRFGCVPPCDRRALSRAADRMSAETEGGAK